MKKEYIDFYDRCIKVWGEDAQVLMCIEEMSELTKELCKNFRKKSRNTPEQKQKICEEIADIQNMVDQMQHLFGEDYVDEIREQKRLRTIYRLDEEEGKK